MINQLDDVILTCDLPEHGLSAGDIGSAVLMHRHGAGYEGEFTSLDGDTIAVVTLLGRCQSSLLTQIHAMHGESGQTDLALINSSVRQASNIQ